MDWYLEDGLVLVRSLQPKTRAFGYHLTLGGGVLNTGKSTKDIDLYFLPLDNGTGKPKAKELLAWLQGLWGPGSKIASSQGEEPPPGEPTHVTWPQAQAIMAGKYCRYSTCIIKIGLSEEYCTAHADPMNRVSAPPPPPTFRRSFVREPEFVQREYMGGQWVTATTTNEGQSDSTYTYKWKFIRSGGDRIDVFII